MMAANVNCPACNQDLRDSQAGFGDNLVSYRSACCGEQFHWHCIWPALNNFYPGCCPQCGGHATTQTLVPVTLPPRQQNGAPVYNPAQQQAVPGIQIGQRVVNLIVDFIFFVLYVAVCYFFLAY